MQLMNCIAEGLGAISITLNGDSTKVTIIKARLLNSFTGKETKTKRVWMWLHQVEAYMDYTKLKHTWKHNTSKMTFRSNAPKGALMGLVMF
jgi:hypothetical protein